MSNNISERSNLDEPLSEPLKSLFGEPANAPLAEPLDQPLDTSFDQPVNRLGFCARDVRHILLTHLDFDHAGGVEDFPEATVHVMQAEIDAAQDRHSLIASQRYRPG